MAKAGRKTKIEEWLLPDNLLIIKGWARDGLTDKEICDEQHLNISHTTFYDWIKKHHEFSDTIKEGRKPIIVNVEDTFFTKKLQGYTVTETTKEKTVQRDASGNITGSTEHVRENERYIPPDTTAMIFYLKTHKPKLYNDKLSVTVENEKSDEKLEKLIQAVRDVK